MNSVLFKAVSQYLQAQGLTNPGNLNAAIILACNRFLGNI